MPSPLATVLSDGSRVVMASLPAVSGKLVKLSWAERDVGPSKFIYCPTSDDCGVADIWNIPSGAGVSIPLVAGRYPTFQIISLVEEEYWSVELVFELDCPVKVTPGGNWASTCTLFRSVE